MDRNLTLVDPDPGKAYTRAKKAKCNFCTEDTQLTNSNNEQPEDPVTDMEEHWNSDTSVLQSSFLTSTLLSMLRKLEEMRKAMLKNPLEKDTSFSMKNTVMMSVVRLKTMKYM